MRCVDCSDKEANLNLCQQEKASMNTTVTAKADTNHQPSFIDQSCLRKCMFDIKHWGTPEAYDHRFDGFVRCVRSCVAPAPGRAKFDFLE
jgi:hypothetical protein